MIDTTRGGSTKTASGPERISFLATKTVADTDVVRWAAHILLASASKVDAEEVRARALDYAQPGAPRMEVGTLAALPDTHSDAPGFDPLSGCHVIVPDGRYARFVVDGRRQRRYSPAFQILNAAGPEATVYVDQLIFERVARDRAGNLVFQLPGVITGEVLVEVLFRNPG